MSLTALEMKRLEDDARAMATRSSRGYLSDALRCLRETGDPILSLALLRAMWGTADAMRRDQKGALDDVGRWLDGRLARDPGISSDRLALELGWLQRLVSIHGGVDDQDSAEREDRNRRPRQSSAGTPGREEPSFAAHIERLRRKREIALATIIDRSPVRPSDIGEEAKPSCIRRADHLPETFEVCFVSRDDALGAFKVARKRRKEQKSVRDRLLPLRPVAADLRHLGVDLACSLVETEGMEELQARTQGDPSRLPPFWVATADLIERDGKRVARRIAFGPKSPLVDARSGHQQR